MCNKCNKFKELETYISNLNTKEGALIGVLHHAQGLYGYLGEDVQEFIAEKLNIPKAKVFGVISFYSYFQTEPKGKYVISVCTGTACFVRGAEEILEEFKKRLKIDVGETTPDGNFTLDTLRCVGACGLAPVVSIGDKLYGNLKKEDVGRIIKEFWEGQSGQD